MAAEGNRERPRRHRLALLVPFAWQLGLAGVVNDIAWRPLGLPFAMVWQMLGVVVASLSIAWVFHRDNVLGLDDEAADPR